MIFRVSHITDSLLTQELARESLPAEHMVVNWYTNKANTSSVVHSHPYYELILPMCGEVRYASGGSLYHLRKGELIVFPDELYHMGRFDVTPEVSQRLILQIDATLWYEVSASAGMEALLPREVPTIISADAVSAWDLKGLFLRISRAASMPDAQRPAVFRAQLTELMNILQICLTADKTIAADATSELVDKAQRYIQQHYTEPDFSINILADQLFVSRSHISRLFHEYTMESIHGYITGLRLQHFKLCLGAGMSILEASCESGFSDYSSFLKTFRKTYGITPSAFRKQLQQGSTQEVADVRELTGAELSMLME